MKKQEVILEISVKGMEKGTQSTFRNSIYTKDIDPKVFENTMTAFTFFENVDGWAYAADIKDFQKIELAAIENQFRKKVRDLVQSKLDSKDPGDATPWQLTSKQTAEISKELVPLEIATEIMALNVLLPHQQRMVFKQHFDALGWKSLDSVYGNVALGLNEKQKSDVEKIIGDIEEARKKARQSSLKNRKEIDRRLWEMVIAELTEDQQKRFAIFRTAFLDRLRKRISYLNEKYKVDGINIQVHSARRMKDGVHAGEVCWLQGSLEEGGVLNDIELYSHSLQDLELDKLPVVGNQSYLLGMNLGAKEKDAINSIRIEFLSEVARFMKAGYLNATKRGATAKKVVEVALSAQTTKAFRESSSKCYEVLNKTQRKVLLENRLGFELFRKGITVFQSKIFCKQLNLDDAQRNKILELIEKANVRLAEVEALEKKTLKDLDVQVESEIEKAVTQEQLEFLNEIR